MASVKAGKFHFTETFAGGFEKSGGEAGIVRLVV
jgi:hypothetical protein